ncbi:MAG TPA: cytochrome c [Anaeromyxobacteraceae bacterium]|nr:cytochrome c [Anaeromyxobacteraceae bacterium]
MKKLAVVVALVAFAGVASANDGGAVFAKRCAACHGKDGKGQTPVAKKLGVKDLTATTLDRKGVEQIVTEGKGKMAGFKGKLTDQEIQSVSSYVKKGLK